MRFRSALFGSACLLAAFTGCDPKPKEKPEAQPAVLMPKKAETLDPDDIGIGKYVFEEKVPAGKVMVLRLTSGVKGEGEPHLEGETLAYSDGGSARLVVLMYDAFKFPIPSKRELHIHIRHPLGSMGYGDRYCSTVVLTPGRLHLEFKHDDKGTETLTYECFIEDHAAAKKRVPDLPDAKPGASWTYNAPAEKVK
jgi:hypothetical protein